MFVLLTFVIILVTVLSYIIPAGVYDTVIDPVSGRSVIDPNSYHHVERTPVSLMQFIASFSNGFAAVAPLMFMTMAVGGAFGVIDRLGIIPAAVELARNKFSRNRFMAIPVLLFCFIKLGPF